MLRTGGDATAMVNDLRTLRGATPLGTVSEQDLLDERGRELYAEQVRRNDMIRFGQYLRGWELKVDRRNRKHNPFVISNSITTVVS